MPDVAGNRDRNQVEAETGFASRSAISRFISAISLTRASMMSSASPAPWDREYGLAGWLLYGVYRSIFPVGARRRMNPLLE
jgi:hypothetical protein